MVIRSTFWIPFLLGGLLLFGCGTKPDPKFLGQSLARAVPLESTPAQVLSYLDGQKIEHSGYKRDEITGYAISATIPDSRRGWTKTNCMILFRFDKHDRLIASDVREDHEGP